VGGRGPVYGMPGSTIDGNDAMTVYETAGEAVRRARSGGGPTLIECKTYRTRAHAEGMRDQGYRTPAEVEEWKTRDPIQAIRRRIIEEGAADAVALDAVDQAVKMEAEEALEFAKSSPWPDPSTALDYAYSAPRG
jgi:2-oxoisovalerate dehydrogenase E1 component